MAAPQHVECDVTADPIRVQQADADSEGYCRTVMAMPLMQEWIAAAKLEPDEVEELDEEF